jgi:hypothetical protein
MEIVRKIFPRTRGNDPLSDFFINSSVKDKKKVLKKVGRAANRDQKELVSEYKRSYSKTSCGVN